MHSFQRHTEHLPPQTTRDCKISLNKFKKDQIHADQRFSKPPGPQHPGDHLGAPQGQE